MIEKLEDLPWQEWVDLIRKGKKPEGLDELEIKKDKQWITISFRRPDYKVVADLHITRQGKIDFWRLSRYWDSVEAYERAQDEW